MKTSKPTKYPIARENAGEQVVFGFSFASDWLREWREFSGPITERGEAKSVQSRKTFDTIKGELTNRWNIIPSSRSENTPDRFIF